MLLVTAASVLKMTSECGGLEIGCLSLRMSRTLLPHPSITSFSFNGADPVSLVRSCKVALTLPSVINLENIRATPVSIASVVFCSDF